MLNSLRFKLIGFLKDGEKSENEKSFFFFFLQWALATWVT